MKAGRARSPLEWQASAGNMRGHALLLTCACVSFLALPTQGAILSGLLRALVPKSRTSESTDNGGLLPAYGYGGPQSSESKAAASRSGSAVAEQETASVQVQGAQATAVEVGQRQRSRPKKRTIRVKQSSKVKAAADDLGEQGATEGDFTKNQEREKRVRGNQEIRIFIPGQNNGASEGSFSKETESLGQRMGKKKAEGSSSSLTTVGGGRRDTHSVAEEREAETEAEQRADVRRDSSGAAEIVLRQSGAARSRRARKESRSSGAAEAGLTAVHREEARTKSTSSNAEQTAERTQESITVE